MAGRLLVLTGPSGVGKGTVVAHLRRLRPDLWVSVSATTRRPRAGEVDGRDYLFVSDEGFDDLVRSGGLLEWAAFAGNRYGTPRQSVGDHLQRGDVLLEIDLSGARQVRAAMPECLAVFLSPPDMATLESRLRGRGTEPEDAITRRLARATEELAAQHEFDAVVVSDDPRRAAADVAGLLAGEA